MDNRDILTRFKSGTLERRHAIALLTGSPATPPGPAATPPPGPATVGQGPAAMAQGSAVVDAPGAVAAGSDAVGQGPGVEPCALIALHGRFPQDSGLEAFPGAAQEAREPAASGPTDRFTAQEGPFDPELLGVDPAEAALMGPQERLLLESAWQALEGSGYVGARLGRLTGADGAPRAVGVFTAAAPARAAGRLSRVLDLRGPSQGVDTADSSFLTALHLALASLRAGECAAALVAAAELRPDGGETAAALLLRPLPAALADGDPVHAVLLAGAVGHTGRGAPGPLRELLTRRALAAARIPAAGAAPTEDATRVGEATALTRAVLRLRHATRLPSPATAGPTGEATGSGRPKAAGGREDARTGTSAGGDRAGVWSGPGPRRVVVGAHPQRGAHAVVVLQEAPPAGRPAGPVADAGAQLVLVSAPTPAHLAATARRIAGWLARPEAAEHGLAAVAGELRTGRAAMACRLALVAHDLPGLAAALADFAERGPAAPDVRTADLRTVPADPLLLDGLDETLAYVGALWHGSRWEQLTRLWLAGLDVLGAAPEPPPGTGRVSALPTSVLRISPLAPRGGRR